MSASALVYLYVRSPITPNHQLFEGFVNLTILFVAFRHRRLPIEAARAATFSEAAPVLRALLLALYGFAFLHKLNWTFLEPATSCASFMLDGIADRLGMPHSGGVVPEMAVWATLAAEGGIPLLLLFPRTRRLALLLAWPFHFALTLHPRPGIYGFSAMLFTMLTLFLPRDFFATLAMHPWLRRLVGADVRRFVRRAALILGAAAVALGTLAALTIEITPGASYAIWMRRLGMLLWMPYSVALLGALLLGWPAANSEERAGTLLHIHRSPAAALLVLFVLNGMAPYFGFQTLRTMSMFSNLRTEGGWTNHLFIPSSLQITFYQKDLVRLIGSSDPWLDFYVRNESLLPYSELRRRVWEHPDVPVQVTYERNGRIETLDTSQPGADRQVPPLPTPVNKILAFREVDQDGRPVRCLW